MKGSEVKDKLSGRIRVEYLLSIWWESCDLSCFLVNRSWNFYK